MSASRFGYCERPSAPYGMSPNNPIVYLSGPRPWPGEAGPDAAPAEVAVATAAAPTAAAATNAVRRRRSPGMRKVMSRLPFVVSRSLRLPGLPRSVAHTCGQRSNGPEAVPLKGDDE